MLYPLKSVIEDREQPLCVRSGTMVRDALRQMIDNDFSQLPVVDENGDLLGIISEQDIIRTQFHLNTRTSVLDLRVEQCAAQPVTFSLDDDLFDAIDRLERVYAVLVVENRKPVGILTTYDTTHFFRQLSEGQILIQDIELTLRGYIKAAFPTDSTMAAALIRAFRPDRADPRKPSKEYDHLTLGEHVQLITSDENWTKFQSVFEPKSMFQDYMKQVTDIRNQLAHFRGELDKIQLDALTRVQTWLENSPRLPSAEPTHLQTIQVTDSVTVDDSVVLSGTVTLTGSGSLESRDSTPGRRGKYAPLGDWLVARDPQERTIRVTFHDIETLLGQPLPSSAYSHRLWWANFRFEPHRQSAAWTGAGWRVEDVDFAAQEVTFTRTNAPVEEEGTPT